MKENFTVHVVHFLHDLLHLASAIAADVFRKRRNKRKHNSCGHKGGKLS